jgi:hypothetical protein
LHDDLARGRGGLGASFRLAGHDELNV